MESTKMRREGLLRAGWRRSIRFGFRLLYHELAWSYDGVAWLVSLGQWRAWTRAVLPHLAGTRVLELGHGPGHLLATLQTRGFYTVGLDRSPQMGQLARRRLHRASLAQALVQGRAQALPFPDRSFDNVVAVFPTAYILAPATLQEVARVLRHKGRLVVVLGARLQAQGRLGRGLSRGLRGLYTLTGQETAPVEAWAVPMAQAGLSVRQVTATVKGSQVSLLIARVDGSGRHSS
jgi:SAM-dependent methyltransferase